MKSWAQQKREAKEAAYEAQDEARRAEEARVASLSMWERIEECDASESVKAILHILAEK
jgi:hypothetical protein